MIENVWNIEATGSEFIKLYKKHASTKDALRKWKRYLADVRIESILSPTKSKISDPNTLPKRMKPWKPLCKLN